MNWQNPISGRVWVLRPETNAVELEALGLFISAYRDLGKAYHEFIHRGSITRDEIRPSMYNPHQVLSVQQLLDGIRMHIEDILISIYEEAMGSREDRRVADMRDEVRDSLRMGRGI